MTVPASDPPRDRVDQALDAWCVESPDLPTAGLSVSLRLVLLGKLIERDADATFARWGSETWEVDVLAALRRQGPPYALSAGALAEQVLLTCSGLSHRLNRLEQRGLIVRESDPHDRRRVAVVLTPAGRQLAEAVVPQRAQETLRLLGGLTRRERERLEALLRKLLLTLEPDRA